MSSGVEGQLSLTFCPNLFTSVVTEGSQTIRHEIKVMLVSWKCFVCYKCYNNYNALTFSISVCKRSMFMEFITLVRATP